MEAKAKLPLYLSHLCSNCMRKSRSASHADFGPADGDVKDAYQRQYEQETGEKVSTNWRSE